MAQFALHFLQISGPFLSAAYVLRPPVVCNGARSGRVSAKLRVCSTALRLFASRHSGGFEHAHTHTDPAHKLALRRNRTCVTHTGIVRQLNLGCRKAVAASEARIEARIPEDNSIPSRPLNPFAPPSDGEIFIPFTWGAGICCVARNGP